MQAYKKNDIILSFSFGLLLEQDYPMPQGFLHFKFVTAISADKQTAEQVTRTIHSQLHTNKHANRLS